MSNMDQMARQLRDADRARRAQAIKALGKSGDQRALKLLAWSVKNDPDPQVQQYARKAYNHLKGQVGPSRPASKRGTVGAASLLAYSQRKSQEKQASQGGASAASSPPENDSDAFDFGYVDEDEGEANNDRASADEEDPYEGLYETETLYADDEDDYPDEGSLFAFDDVDDDYGTGQDDMETGPIAWEARKAVHAAMDLLMENENEKALKKLLEAIEIDPRAARETEALGVAAEITQMDGQAAMDAIQDPDFQRNFLQMSRKAKRAASEGDPDWGATWMDIGIYGLVLTVGIVTLTLVMGTRFEALFNDYANNPGRYDVFVEAFELDVNDMADADFTGATQFIQASIPFIILGAIFISIISIITSFIPFFAIHFAAINFFKGQKPSAVTIDKLFNTTTIITGISFAIVLISMFLVPNQPQAYADGSGITTAEGVIDTTNLLTGLTGFIGGIWQAYVLGRAQKIGFLSGCLSIWVGVLLLVGLSCGCFCTFFFMAGTINVFG